ncbi:MAG: DUF948 domain-containing protein [Cyanobacteriota bacterium]
MFVSSTSNFHKNVNYYGKKQPVFADLKRQSEDIFVSKRRHVSPVSFSGLTSDFANKVFQTYENAIDSIIKHNHSKGYVGNPPQEWLQKLPEKNKRENILALYRAFDIACVMLSKPTSDINEISQELTDTLRKINVLKQDQAVKLRKVDYGGFGVAYQVEPSGNFFKRRYILKNFYGSGVNNSGDRDIHGNPVEINRAMFWLKNVDKSPDLPENSGKKSNRPRFYFGNVNLGYMLIQYIDAGCKNPKQINLADYGLQSCDDKDNEKNGYFYDFGGIYPVSVIANNKTARYVYQKILKTPEKDREAKWNEVYENDRVSNKSDILIGLAAAVRLLPDQLKQTEYFEKVLKKNSSEEVKAAISECVTAYTTSEGLEMIEAEITPDQIEELIFNINDIVPDKRLGYFTKIAQKATSEQAASIVSQLETVPESDRSTLCQKMVDIHPKLSRMIVLKIDVIPECDRPELIIKLAQADDARYQNLLVEHIRSLSEETKFLLVEQIKQNYPEIASIYKEAASGV